MTHLKARSDAALKLYKELQREEAAQVWELSLQIKIDPLQTKDANAAAGKSSGGFCGGSTKDVHDPSREPGPAPVQRPGLSQNQETEAVSAVNKTPAAPLGQQQQQSHAQQPQQPPQRLLRSE